MTNINLKGLNKAAVLAALYNASKPQGMGFMHYNPTPMTIEEAEGLLERTYDFDYLKGRVMKVNLDGETLDPSDYDRDNGEGAAAAAIASLKITRDVNNEAIAKAHMDGTFLSALDAQTQLNEETRIGTLPEFGGMKVILLGLGDFKEQLGPLVKKAKMDNMNDGGSTSLFCMCESIECALEVELPLSEAREVLRDEKNIVIVDGCPNGPEPTDKLIEKRSGYTLYQES